MFRDVDPQTANELVQQGYTYLDVRTVEEFDQGHPVGAYNIPAFFRGPGGMQPNPDFLHVVKARFQPDSKLVVGCASGRRSMNACQALATAGFTDLANVTGGYGEWAARGLPTSTSAEGRDYASLSR